MSKRQSCEADAKLFLSKKENLTISKTLDVCIEDFLGKLEYQSAKSRKNEEFIQLPEIPIGYHLVNIQIYDENNEVCLRVETSVAPGSKDMGIIQRGIILRTCKVEGVCGNISFEKEEVSDPGYYCVQIKSMKDLKEAMIASGSHKLDLKITLTMVEDEWIVTR